MYPAARAWPRWSWGAGLARGDGRGAHALHRLRRRRPPRQDDAEAIELARLWFSYLPLRRRSDLPTYEPEEPARPLTAADIPERESQPFDIHDVIDGLVDDDSFFEVKPLFAPELVVGIGRVAGESVGIVANNSMAKGASSSPTAPTRRPASSGCATRTRSRSSTSPTCRAS